jgi:anti-sigma B factor antagonist
MAFSIEETGPVVVARLHGDMWGRPEDTHLKVKFASLAEDGHHRFILDFEEISAINSTGIGVVVSCLTAVQAHGGRLRLCNLNQRLRSTFEVTGLSKMLSFYGTVESAVDRPWPK